jgi:hypothetical protein
MRAARVAVQTSEPFARPKVIRSLRVCVCVCVCVCVRERERERERERGREGERGKRATLNTHTHTHTHTHTCNTKSNNVDEPTAHKSALRRQMPETDGSNLDRLSRILIC